VTIAFVVAGGVDRSGRERVVPALLWFLERLARRHQVHVIALDQYPEPCTYTLLGATVHNLGAPRGLRGLGLLRLWPRLVSALRGLGPVSVLHAYMGVPSGALAVLAGRLLGIPVLVSFDGNELTALPQIGYGLPLTRRGRLVLSLNTQLATRLTVSTGYMQALAERRGLRVERVAWGVDTALFTPSPEPPGPPWRLLHIAHLNPVKDQATLLEAFSRVRQRLGDVRLDVAGVDTLRGAVQARAHAMGLADHVVFHGLLPVDALPALYRSCHLLVQSSLHEAGGVAVLEAAACGRVTVGTAVGHVADGPDRSLAVPPGDPQALAEAIVALLLDSDGRQGMAARAAAWARAHDADCTTARFEEIYEGLTGVLTRGTGRT
jgi:glycosyltransferase involved in cell wall biosynthesis